MEHGQGAAVDLCIPERKSGLGEDDWGNSRSRRQESGRKRTDERAAGRSSEEGKRRTQTGKKQLYIQGVDRAAGAGEREPKLPEICRERDDGRVHEDREDLAGDEKRAV